MRKQIKLVINGEPYVLEFNRAIILEMEKNGLTMESFDKFKDGKDMSGLLDFIPNLFFYSFKMHHPTVTFAEADEWWDSIPRKEDFLIKLVELWSEPMVSLMREPEKGNVNWEVN